MIARIGVALLILLPLIPVVASAPPGVVTSSCTFSGDYGTCTFVCAPGQFLYVRAQTLESGGYPSIRATCGGATAACQRFSNCEATGGPAATGGVGTCVALTIAVSGECAAYVGDPLKPIQPQINGMGDCRGLADTSRPCVPIVTDVETLYIMLDRSEWLVGGNHVNVVTGQPSTVNVLFVEDNGLPGLQTTIVAYGGRPVPPDNVLLL